MYVYAWKISSSYMLSKTTLNIKEEGKWGEGRDRKETLKIQKHV